MPADRRYKPRTIRTPTKKRVFLEVLAQGKSVTMACEKARVARSAMFTWRSEDPQFKKEWEEAIERGDEYFEDEARRRAVEGTLKPVYQGGIRVGTIREYSDSLLMFQMKGRMPKYRDSAQPDAASNTVRVINVPAPAEGNSPTTPSFRTRERLE